MLLISAWGEATQTNGRRLLPPFCVKCFQFLGNNLVNYFNKRKAWNLEDS